MATPPNICFYSNRCAWSKAFIDEIAKTPYKKEFSYICVDKRPDGSRAQLPAWLKQTPTLVIRGEESPRIDGDVMNWLSERRIRESSSQGGGPRAAGAADPAAAVEPEAWNRTELGLQNTFQLGSQYSFIGTDTSATGTGGTTIPGAYSFLNGQAAPAGRDVDAFPQGGGEKKTKREEMFDQQMEEYMRNRNTGMPPTIART